MTELTASLLISGLSRGVAPVVLAALVYAPFLSASPRIGVTPMIHRLSDKDIQKRPLVVSTELTLAESTLIRLELVRPEQREDGQIAWVGDVDKRPSFFLPFTERFLSKGVHTLSFSRNPGEGGLPKALRFAVAITYKDREIKSATAEGVVLKADVRLRQIFQITHPGSVRGVRRYRVDVGKKAVDKKGFLTFIVTNRGPAPFYLKASSRLSAQNSGKRPPARSLPMFLLADGVGRNGRIREEVPLYPNAPVRIVADIKSVEPGDYRARLTLTMRDRLGKRSIFLTRDFQKKSPATKTFIPKRGLEGLRATARHSRLGTEIILSSRTLSGLLRLTARPNKAPCKPRNATTLIQPGRPARIILGDAAMTQCLVTVTHQKGKVKLLLKDGRIRLLPPGGRD